MIPSDDIMAKIAKLLNLAEHPTANPGEAANAAAMAQALILKYNLDRAQIRRDDGKPIEPELAMQSIAIPGSGPTQWRIWITNDLAMYNFCSFVRIAGTAKGYLFGEQHNIEVVLYLATVIIREIHRLANTGWRDVPDQQRYKEGMWKRSFCEGARLTVMHRLAAEQHKATQDAVTQALVVVTEERLNAFIASKMQTHMKESRSKVYDVAYADGRIAGQGIALHRGMGEGTAQRAITEAR